MSLRDPSSYSPTVHCVQQYKHRDIALEDIAATIKEGKQKTTHKEDVYLFIKEFSWYEQPIGVVANIKNGNILTVEYRDKD